MKRRTGMLIVAMLLATLVVPLAGTAAADEQTRVLAIVRFEGIIESRPADPTLEPWVISGQQVKVVARTRIVEDEGPAEVGARVVVNATRSGDELTAIQIRVVEASQATVRIKGIVSEMLEEDGQTYIVVNGLKVEYNAETEIIGELKAGALVKIEALVAGSGFTATKIEVLGFPWAPRIVEFEGTIESIEDSTWVVGEHEFTVSGLTVIIGAPEVGKHAEVRALQQSDESLVALWIRIKEEPETDSWEGRIDRLPWLRWGFWVVGGKAVIVTASTEITGQEPAVGKWAKVEAQRVGLLPWHAVKIEVSDPPSTGPGVPEVEVQ